MRELETKTVFDPNAFSDVQMNAMARDAGKLGWDSYQEGRPGYLGRTDQFEVTVDGVRFRVYINFESGTGNADRG
jgi:hypothetical protein